MTLKRRLGVSTFELNSFVLSVLRSPFVFNICSDDWLSDSCFFFFLHQRVSVFI